MPSPVLSAVLIPAAGRLVSAEPSPLNEVAVQTPVIATPLPVKTALLVFPSSLVICTGAPAPRVNFPDPPGTLT